MTIIAEAPCKNCIIAPICRNKNLRQLFFECMVLRSYLYGDQEPARENRNTSFKYRISRVVSSLQPEWEVGFLKSGEMYTCSTTNFNGNVYQE